MPDLPVPVVPPVEASPNALRAIIRTAVPYVIGFLVTWLGSKGINLPQDIQAQLSALITVAVGSAYYAIAKELEKTNPAFGWLLGAKGAPIYLPSNVAVPPAVPLHVEVEPVDPEAGD